MRTPGTPHARAGIVLLNLTDQACLLGYRENNGRTYYTVPGGEIELNESPEQTARREFTEETSLTAEKITLLATFANPQDPSLTEHLFITTAATGDFNPANDPDRALDKPDGQVWDIRWVPFARLAEIPLLPNTAKQALQSYLNL